MSFLSHALHILLVTLLALAPVLVAASYTQSETIGIDSSSVLFSSGWSTVSNAAGTFTEASGKADEVEIFPPTGTVSMSYVGFKRTGGALYAVCLDCGTSGQQLMQINASDPNADTSTPVVLFSFTSLDPTTSHHLQVVNSADPAFGDTSELTFKELNIQVDTTVLHPSRYRHQPPHPRLQPQPPQLRPRLQPPQLRPRPPQLRPRPPQLRPRPRPLRPRPRPLRPRPRPLRRPPPLVAPPPQHPPPPPPLLRPPPPPAAPTSPPARSSPQRSPPPQQSCCSSRSRSSSSTARATASCAPTPSPSPPARGSRARSVRPPSSPCRSRSPRLPTCPHTRHHAVRPLGRFPGPARRTASGGGPT
ncbi:hypothetical protein DAEQUDRAFT_6486 [Daedalea quercina L-15889]|uniref:Uncharacterized protein n=1 Tax=Daedalea quercina L-15889 TaxID=1314783 RepID=A0A165UE73_9APHY|nr:hypothetical protein DAEQUDRAFT_6486 [Daedalea quercina L-15889]